MEGLLRKLICSMRIKVRVGEGVPTHGSRGMQGTGYVQVSNGLWVCEEIVYRIRMAYGRLASQTGAVLDNSLY